VVALRRILLTFHAVALVSCASLPEGPTYLNPVLARDFPDPAILHAPDGFFYAYATQTIRDGATVNIQGARSRNLVDWEYLGEMLPQKPTWGRSKQSFWAPHVLHDAAQGKYFMYYSAETDHRPGKCLAVATADRPAGPFTDSGEPMLCGEKFEHIDPMAFDDPKSGKRLLYWGSGFQPIRVRELDASRLNFTTGSAAVDLVLPGPGTGHDALVEAAWVAYRDPVYYLYYSTGLCCGPHARYSITIAKSYSAFGPFEPLGTPILGNNGFWRAPGHNSVVTDARGDDWLLYHAIDATREHFEDRVAGKWSARLMLLDRIFYQDGWPRVAGDQPSVTRGPAPATTP
jgi:arabinan endo-1,5-alpha-L-arabinosidase